jgi:glycosyltransferase involved in cell wall biosynthesis
MNGSKVVNLVLNNFINDSRVLKTSISLHNLGFNVIVVAMYDIGVKEKEIIENIPVHRIKLKSRKWPKKKLIQVLKYLEFICKVIKLYRKVDIVHCNDLKALPIGWLIKSFFNSRAKLVYDAHEYETEMNGMTATSKYIARFVEKRCIKKVDIVITVTDMIAQEYQRIYAIPKPYVVLNTPFYKKLDSKGLFRTNLNIEDHRLIFLYQGGLCSGRGIEVLLDVFKQLPDDKVIIFMGYGPLERTIIDVAKEFNNIYFHPAVSPSILLNYTSSADVGISFIENCSLSDYYCLPNKLFEYIMAELPVIVSNLPEMKRLVDEREIGLVVNDKDESALMCAIKSIDSDKIKKFKAAAQKTKLIYCWENDEKVLTEIYNDFLFKNKM